MTEDILPAVLHFPNTSSQLNGFFVGHFLTYYTWQQSPQKHASLLFTEECLIQGLGSSFKAKLLTRNVGVKNIPMLPDVNNAHFVRKSKRSLHDKRFPTLRHAGPLHGLRMVFFHLSIEYHLLVEPPLFDVLISEFTI